MNTDALAGFQPLLDELEVLDDPVPHPAALNMAIDEALLGRLGNRAVLRCYRWTRPAVSFGCFGRIHEVRDAYPGRELVRRWTGGGIVDHAADFTFSLLVPKVLPLASLPAAEAYPRVHTAVAMALTGAGFAGVENVPARTGVSHPEFPPATQPPPHLLPCFEHPVAHDLTQAGRKVAGGAQRRTRMGLLHQGSVQKLSSGSGAWAAEERQVFAGMLMGCLGAERSCVAISPSIIEAAEEIAAHKYGAPSWLERL